MRTVATELSAECSGLTIHTYVRLSHAPSMAIAEGDAISSQRTNQRRKCPSAMIMMEIQRSRGGRAGGLEL